MAFECLLGLIMLSLFFTDTSKAEVTCVFIGSGDDVHLPCNNALSDCTSTTWTYSKHSETIEVVTLGKIKEHFEKLRLGSNCSLNINKVTEVDNGFYSCRQYVNEQQLGNDAVVTLHVLHVSSSSSQTEFRPGSSVTLYCQLDEFYGFACDNIVNEEIKLMWVNQAGVSLMKDLRYQISSLSLCKISLTTTLLNEDNNREWRCQLSQSEQLKASATFTVKYSVLNEKKTEIPVRSTQETTVITAVTPSQPGGTEESARGGGGDRNLISPSVMEIVVIFAVLALLVAAVVLFVNCKKRADKSRGTDVDTEEHKDDVTYSEVVIYSKLGANKVDNKVTYSSIRAEKAEAQENCCHLYASVN